MSRPVNMRPPWEEIFSSLGDGLIILDPQQIVIGMNPSAASMSGLSVESTLGRSLEEAFPGNESVIKKFHKAFAEGGAMTLYEETWKGWRKGKSIVDLSLNPLVSEDRTITGWILVFRDVTPLKNLQEEVRKADRLATMGTIASGLAHEIKNPLGGIKGAAQLLAREPISEESQECVRIIIKEAERVNRLVSQLLRLTRPKQLEFEPVNLNQLLEELILLERSVVQEKKIKIIREFDPSLPMVKGDYDELKQAFLNFFKNAVEAVEEGQGEIRLKSRIVTDFKVKEGETYHRFVSIEIQDNGEGISAENLSQIFTPFFTTKTSGTGLGLAICQQIIHEHGGTVRLTSEKKKGTSVQVSLRS